MIRTVCLAAAAALFCASSASAQPVTLQPDAEYAGALLTGPVRLYGSGRVQSATLKTDYPRGLYLFAAGSQISFYETGAVQSGVLKQDVNTGRYVFAPGAVTFHPNGAVETASVKTGFADANLVLPVPGSVGLDPTGRIVSFNPAASTPYRVLDRTVQTTTGFAFDPAAEAYQLVSGAAGAPQLIARVVAKVDEYGNPIAVTPVIAPVGSFFKFSSPSGLPADFSARWQINGFTLNGQAYGPTPGVWVRDMQVRMVEVAVPITIGGVTYQGGQRVYLDVRGGPIPPR